MRKQLLEALRSKKPENHFFLPLCVHDYFEAMDDYAELLRSIEKALSSDEYPTLGNRIRFFLSPAGLRYRLKFCQSIGAVFLGWCQGAAFTSTTDSSVKVASHTEGSRTVTVFNTPVGSLQTVSEVSSVSKVSYTTERLLKTEDDARAYMYIAEATTFAPSYEEAQRQLDIVGEMGIYGAAGFSCPFHDLLYAYGAETFLVMSFDLPSVVTELMEVLHKKNLARCELLAGSPLCVFDHECAWDVRQISPRLFHEYYVPYQKEYNNIFHSAGKICMDHASGQDITPYLEGLEACGHDLIYGLTLAEDNASNLVELLDRWRGRIVPCVGPSPDFLRRKSAAEVRQLCDSLLEKTPDRKLLMGTADAVVPGTPPENLATVSQRLRAAEAAGRE